MNARPSHKGGSTPGDHSAPAHTANNARSRISVVFGDPILDAGHTATPNLILNSYARLSITPQEMMFIIHLLQYKWDARDPYPSLGSVARRMGVSLRQVQRYEASLIKKGYLSVHARISPERGQLSNEYNFAPLIERILALDERLDTSSSARADAGQDDKRPPEAAHHEIKREQKHERQGSGQQASDLPPLSPMSSPPLTPLSGEEETSKKNTHPNRSNSSKIEISETVEKIIKTETMERNERQEREAGSAKKQGKKAKTRPSALQPERGGERLRLLPRANKLRDSSPKDFEKLSDLLRSHVVAPASSFAVSDTSSHPSTRALRTSKDLASGLGRGRAGAKQRVSHDTKAQEASRAQDGPANRRVPDAPAARAASARIADLIRQISQEFGDSKVNANISQADRLWAMSGLTEMAYLDWLYTIRSEIRANRLTIRRPMAYFFTILRRRLRLDTPHTQAS